GLHQDDLVVLAQLRQPLHRPLLLRQALLADRLGLEPVEVIGQVDHRIGALFVEQQGQAGRVPAVFRRTRCQESDVLLGPETNQRLPEGIATTQQHQAHTHRVSRSEQVDRRKANILRVPIREVQPYALDTTPADLTHSYRSLGVFLYTRQARSC